MQRCLPAPTAFARLLRRKLSGRWEYLYLIFLPRKQHRLLQPRHGSTHSGVVGGRVPLEYALILLSQYLARRGHHMAFQALFPVQIPERSQHPVDLPPAQPGAGRHPELTFHVVLGVEQNAPGGLLVAARPSRLL